MPKTKTVKEGDTVTDEEAAANREQREQLAREANQNRNQAMIDARNAIADSADEVKSEEDELEPLTDEVWGQEDGRTDKPKKKTRAELIAEQEEEEGELSEDDAAAKLLRTKEREDRELDEARDQGADDSRKNDDGEVEYRIEGADGTEQWLTLSALRERAGQVSDESDTGQQRTKGVKTPATRGPSPEELERARQAEETRVKAEREQRKQQLRDLYTRASMGDEEAIDALADMQADGSRVTPEQIERMVNERVDARVDGRTAFDRAVEWFEGEFKTELRAPGFKKRAAEIDRRIANEHPTLSPRERLAKTGGELRKELTEMRKFLGVKTPPADEGDGDERRRAPTNRLERKREVAGATPPRASGRARTEEEPDEEQSASEAIQAMARSRGQARPITHKH
jgi:hypothetical protein